MLETLSVFQWSILALAALCIGMSKTGVQGHQDRFSLKDLGLHQLE